MTFRNNFSDNRTRMRHPPTATLCQGHRFLNTCRQSHIRGAQVSSCYIGSKPNRHPSPKQPLATLVSLFVSSTWPQA